MSRSGHKKPVGFATHVTAGGIAGACEAVRPLPQFKLESRLTNAFILRFIAHLPASGHHQSAHAALQVGECSGSEYTNSAIDQAGLN